MQLHERRDEARAGMLKLLVVVAAAASRFMIRQREWGTALIKTVTSLRGYLGEKSMFSERATTNG